MQKISLAAALLLASALPAFADAVTYKGTIGRLAVVMELSDAFGAAGVYGRYFYPRQGIDIPLQAGETSGTLREELPCSVETCTELDDYGAALAPLLGATWTLAASAGGDALTGTWRENGKTLPVTLTRVGARYHDGALDPGPAGLAAAALRILWSGAAIGPDTLPYDDLKMQVALEEGPVTRWKDSSFRYVTDPRTKFAFPRIVTLAEGSPEAANRSLAQRHWAMNADALNCASTVYPGMGWNQYLGAAGGLGDWDQEQVTVDYLSPTVLSWTESGSLWCGGAHPYNHNNILNLDVEAGAPLDLSRIFTFWVPMQGGAVVEDLDAARENPDDYVWGPEPAFVDFLREKRVRSSDPGYEADCEIDTLIPDYLAIGFREGDRVLFTLGTLPHAIQACADDLYEAPIGELMEWLAPTAAAYFPSLARQAAAAQRGP